MSNEKLSDILEKAEKERELGILHIEANAVNDLDEAKKRIEIEITEQRDKDISEYTEICLKNAQKFATEHLTTTSEKIDNASIKFSSNQPAGDPFELTFLYGHISRDVNPNSIAVVIPTPNLTRENGRKYLSERLKAVAFETLLKAKENPDLHIGKITKEEDFYTAFVIDFSSLTPDTKGGISCYYDETCSLDVLFEEAIKEDVVFKNLGITYNGTAGEVLNYIKLSSGGQNEEFPVPIPRPVELFITEEQAVDLVYGLSETQPGYRNKHAIATELFREQVAIGTFSDNFDDFDKDKRGENDVFNRKKIQAMLAGDEEQWKRGRATIRVKCHYAVPVDDERIMMRFFPLGAYTEEDIRKKYTKKELSDHKIRGNFQDEDGTDPYKRIRYKIRRPDGIEMVMYAKEDIDTVVQKK